MVPTFKSDASKNYAYKTVSRKGSMRQKRITTQFSAKFNHFTHVQLFQPFKCFVTVLPTLYMWCYAHTQKDSVFPVYLTL